MEKLRLSEDVDYQLVPSSQAENQQAWDVRILEGQFVETVLRFGAIRFNGENDCLNFNFIIVSTPDGSLTEENEELQDHAAKILFAILEDAQANDALVLGDPNVDSED